MRRLASMVASSNEIRPSPSRSDAGSRSVTTSCMVNAPRSFPPTFISQPTCPVRDPTSHARRDDPKASDSSTLASNTRMLARLSVRLPAPSFVSSAVPARRAAPRSFSSSRVSPGYRCQQIDRLRVVRLAHQLAQAVQRCLDPVRRRGFAKSCAARRNRSISGLNA